MIKITIEFTGLSSMLAGLQRLDLELEEGQTYRDVVRLLSERHPELVGILIAPGNEEFLSSNMLVINGDLANPVMLLDKMPEDGEILHLMSVITGG